MSYADRVLLTGEAIIFRTKKHWIAYLPTLFWLLITVGFLYVPTLKKIVLGPACITAVVFAYNFVGQYFSEYAVTNRRIIMKEGFVFRKSIETMLRSVASIEVDQTLLGGILGYGRISITGYAGADVFNDVARARQFRHFTQEQIAKMMSQFEKM
ncbi:MAG: PH domain-containing protein [Gammaproteobacteria bacterium]